MSYANRTQVSIESSRHEIERLLRKKGATRFIIGWEHNDAAIAFELLDRKLRFRLPMPAANDPTFQRTPRGRARKAGARSDQLAESAHDAECRRRWRALVLVIKAKFEAVESGITTLEQEFLAHIIVPGGQTVGEWARPQIAKAYAHGVAMPPLLGSGP